MEIHELFQNLTIKDLKQQNIKTRTEIESKKEELRFLVGERYRDIIDAADTISDMKACSNEISDSLKKINNNCKKWNSIMPLKSITNTVDKNNKNEDNLRYSVASQIKLLLNMSELIWNAIENGQFSDAAILFNVCRNIAIHSQLSSDKFKIEHFNMEIFFNRQWSCLQNLEETIGFISRRSLRSMKNEHRLEDVQDCLIGIILLEDRRLEDVLQEYLQCVELQIQEWFSSKSAIVHINVQLCSVASIVMKTIDNIYRLFLDGGVLRRLEELSKIIVQNMGCVRGEIIYKFLPEQIFKFKPALKSFQDCGDGIVHETLIDLTNKWLNRLRQKCQSYFIDCFSHLSSIKAVGEARNELKKIFIVPDSLTADRSSPPAWLQLEIDNSTEWNESISRMYSERLKKIIQESISLLFVDWSTSIDRFISANEAMMSEEEFNEDSFFNYFWNECNKDVFFNSDSAGLSSNMQDNKQSENRLIFDSLYNHFSNYFDLGSLNSNKNCNFESLIVKSKVIRPEIFQITKTLNEKLLQLILEIIETVSDCDDFLSTLLSECLSTVVQRCVSWVQANLVTPSTPSPTASRRETHSTIKVDIDHSISDVQLRLLLLCQAVRSLCETAPAFQAGIMTASACRLALLVHASTSPPLSASQSGLARKTKSAKNLRLPYMPGKRLQHQADLEHVMWTSWNETIEPLKSAITVFVLSAVRPSISSLIGQYFDQISDSYLCPDLCDYVATRWTELSPAHADSESSTVPISLAVPSQCSWVMYRLVINVSRLLTVLGGHSLSRENLDEIRTEVLRTVVAQFELLRGSEEFHDNRNSQKQNIQLIFDLRYFLEIINAKAGIQREVQDRLRSMLSEIEAAVDPFDYEMMGESLHQNLQQSVAKTCSLFLLLSSNPSMRNMSTMQRIETGTKQHNLIDLVGAAGPNKQAKTSVRFGRLPISGYMVPTRSSIPNSSAVAESASIVTEAKATVAAAAKSSINNNKTINNNRASSSNRNRTNYLGRLGSNWF